jgi:hypothetical protein
MEGRGEEKKKKEHGKEWMEDGSLTVEDVHIVKGCKRIEITYSCYLIVICIGTVTLQPCDCYFN